MTNEEIVEQIITIDLQMDKLKNELSLLQAKRYVLKSQIKADNVDIEEFSLKQKILNRK